MTIPPQRLNFRLIEEALSRCLLKPEAYPHHATGVYIGGIISRKIPNDAITVCHTLDGRLGVKSVPNSRLMELFSEHWWTVEKGITRLTLEKNQQTHYLYDRRPVARSHALVHVVTPTFQLPPDQIKIKVKEILKELFAYADAKKMDVMSIPPLGMGLLGGLTPPDAAALLVEGLKEYWETHPQGGTTFLVSVDEGWFPEDEYAGMTDHRKHYRSYALFAFEAVLTAMLSTVTRNESIVTDFSDALILGFHWMKGPDFFKPIVYDE